MCACGICRRRLLRRWPKLGLAAGGGEGCGQGQLGDAEVGLGALVLSEALAAPFIPAVQNALKMAFCTFVSGVVALVMWKSGFWDVAEDT